MPDPCTPVPGDSITSIPPPCAEPMVTVSMMGSKSGKEGEEIVQRMQIKRGAKIAKGMKLFGKKFKQDLQSLAFFVGNQQLTGEEVAGTLDGASIFVEAIK